MSVIGAIAGAVGSTALSAGQGALGYGINELFGVRRHAQKQQLEQQNKLNALSFEWNKRQMNYAQELEKQMYQYTFNMNKPEALKNLYKEAGLNPALMYGTSASGVSGTSVGGGRGAGYNSQAANENEIIQSNLALQEMGLQMAKLRSEIDVNKSIADKNKADAGLSKAKTKTEDEQRAAFIAKLYYDGKLSWFETLVKEIKLNTPSDEGVTEIKAKIVHDDLILYGGVAMPEKITQSLFGREIISAIEQSEALADNQIATAALANEQTKHYYTKLMAEIAALKSQSAVNLAKELESKWNIGEHVNWKQILESATSAINTIFKLFIPF